MKDDAIMGGAGAAAIGLLLGSMLGLWLVGQPLNVQPLASDGRVKESTLVQREHWNEITLAPVTIRSEAKHARPAVKTRKANTVWVCDPPRALSSGATQVTPHNGASNFDPMHPNPALGNVTECHTVSI